MPTIRLPVLIPLTAIIPLLFSTAGHTQQFADKSASVTGVSGHRGDDQQLLSVSPLGLNGLAWSESADNPCMFRLLTRDLANGRDTGYGAEFDGLDCPNPVPGAIPAFPWSEDVNFNGNPRYFVRGVAVCNNNKKNQRMKGLRIYPAKVWTTKQQIDELGKKYSDEHALANCRTWSNPVYCPEGKVAFGVVVHYTRDGITGLALRCKTVEW